MNKPDDTHLKASIHELDDDLEKLDHSIETLDTTLEKSLKSHGLWPTFFRGIIGALGAAIGGAIVITALVYILQGLTGVPFVGNYANKVIQSVQQNK